MPAESYREGVVLSKRSDASIIDAGLPKPLTIHNTSLNLGERVVLQIQHKGSYIQARLASLDQVPCYFGLREVRYHNSLKDALSEKCDLRVATSRKGKPINSLATELLPALMKSETVQVLFGSPYEGLPEMARSEGFSLDEKVAFTINTVPDQGTATVRTEEALSATLSVVNLLLHTSF